MRSAAGLTEAAYPAFDFRAQGDRWSRAGQEPHARFQRSYESGRSWEGARFTRITSGDRKGIAPHRGLGFD